MRNFLLIPVLAFVASAQEIDEAALFADTSSVVDSATVVRSVADQVAPDTMSVGFSGSITTVGAVAANREWFLNDDTRFSAAHTRFSSFTVGDGFLDVRLPRGFKAYANLEAQYAADAGVASFALPELFIDANIRHIAYFRAGKQVLQWGRCYLWNPTDLVNVEKKPFIQKMGSREGTYGLKAHVPFGTVVNLYGFAGTRAVTRADSIAAAVKAEVLIRGTEMSLSLWGKRGSKPVYGYDVSTKILGIDVLGEFVLYQKQRYMTIDTVSPPGADTVALGPVEKTRDWSPRFAIDIGKTFNVLGVPDRLRLNGEFYCRWFGDTLHTMPVTLGQQALGGNASGGTLQAAAIASGLYDPNNFSQLYTAVFASLSKFIVPELTLSCNGIYNITQGSEILSLGLDYLMLNNFSLGFLVNGYFGGEDTEYTLGNSALDLRLTAGLTF